MNYLNYKKTYYLKNCNFQNCYNLFINLIIINSPETLPQLILVFLSNRWKRKYYETKIQYCSACY